MKYNIGAGDTKIEGFTNLDMGDSIDLHEFTDEVDTIYSSHFFEYFDDTDAMKLLQSWYNELKPDGLLMLAVPDWEALIQVYNQHGGVILKGPLFGKMQPQKLFKSGHAISPEQADKLRESMENELSTMVLPEGGKKTIYHKTVYDYASLRQVLLSAGFRSIKRCETHIESTLVPNGMVQHVLWPRVADCSGSHFQGIPISLNVICKK
jgi:SAM-dependent methyltransferase